MQEVTIEIYELNELEKDARTYAIEQYKEDHYQLNWQWWRGAERKVIDDLLDAGIAATSISFDLESDQCKIRITGLDDAEAYIRANKMARQCKTLLAKIAEGWDATHWLTRERKSSTFFCSYVKSSKEGLRLIKQLYSLPKLEDYMREKAKETLEMLKQEKEALLDNEIVAQHMEANGHMFKKNGVIYY